MAKEKTAALIVREDVLEWTIVQQRHRVVDAGRAAMSAPAAPEEAADADAEAPAAPPSPLREAAARLKGCALSVGLTTDRLLLRVLDLPAVDRDELRDMVALQFDKYSPFPVDTMVLSYEILRQQDSSSHILMAAVQQSAVDRLGERLREAGLEIDRLDAAILGWWRALADAGRMSQTGRQAFVLLDGPDPEMIVAQDGTPVLFRSLTGPGERPDEDGAAALAEEVSYALMSLERDHGGGAATTVHLGYAGDAEPPHLVRALAYTCECAAESFPLDELPRPSEGLARRAADRTAAAALDLTPAVWRSAEQAREFRNKMIGAAGVIFFAWIASLAVLLGGLQYHRAKLARLEESLASWREPALDVREMRRRAFMIQRYTDNEHSALECLRQISAVQPSGIELTSFAYRKGENVRIAGEAEAVGVVYAFKDSLDRSGFFLESDLTGPRRDTRKRKEIFDIDLRLPEEAG